MRVLLTTIGTRGDVQPLLALAYGLQSEGHQAAFCAPPDFATWIGELGFPFTPIGPPLRRITAPAPDRAAMPTPEQVQQLVDDSVATQVATLLVAAAGADVLVTANGIQVAARSVAEHLGIGYVFTAYCPAALPGPDHPPIPLPGRPPAGPDTDAATLWEQDAAAWTARFGPALNRHRAALGLPELDDVRTHVQTDRPWLAADPVLGPGPASAFQPGAWFVPSSGRLPAEVEEFLGRGEPPVYVGFGSHAAAGEVLAATVTAVRATGRRLILSRGWAELSTEPARDVLMVGEVDHHALFARVAAVVHHGGAGTTTAAARAGAPQVVIPAHYDQPYWAARVAALGIGARPAGRHPTQDALTRSLEAALTSTDRARDVAARIRVDGVRVAVAALAAAGRAGAGTDGGPHVA
jgi:vancomycin aglycone glucosyltransferase